MARPYVHFSAFNNEFGLFALDLVLCCVIVLGILQKNNHSAPEDAVPFLNIILRTAEYGSSFSFRFHCSLFF
jgi:hypothetical protein